MKTVEQIAAEIVAREGGYVNDPDDPGGATKYGVTLATLQRLGLDVTRDGRAVAYSLSRVDWWPEMPVWWWDDRTPQEWAAEGKDPLELCARHWVEETRVIEEGLASVPAGSVLRIRYEDLVADPSRVLGEVAAFAGLDPDNAVWQAELSKISFPDKNAAWNAEIPAEQRAALAVMDDQLNTMGYR